MTFIGHRVDAAILRFDPALGDHQMFAIVGVRFFVVVIVDADAVWGNEGQQVFVRMHGTSRVCQVDSPVLAANKHVGGEDDVLYQTGKFDAHLVAHRQLHHQVDDAAIIVGQVKAFLDPFPGTSENMVSISPFAQSM